MVQQMQAGLWAHERFGGSSVISRGSIVGASMTARFWNRANSPPKLGGVPASTSEQAGWFELEPPRLVLSSFGRGTPPKLSTAFRNYGNVSASRLPTPPG